MKLDITSMRLFYRFISIRLIDLIYICSENNTFDKKTNIFYETSCVGDPSQNCLVR